MTSPQTATATIRLRRDTAARWAFVNPVLADSEPGRESDTGKIKVGDSVHAWNDLPYLPLAGRLTGGLAPVVVQLAWTVPPVVPDATAGNVFRLTLAGPTVLAAPAGGADMQPITVALTQDGAGGRPVTWGAGWLFGAAGQPPLSPGPAATDLVDFRCDASRAGWLCTGWHLGF